MTWGLSKMSGQYRRLLDWEGGAGLNRCCQARAGRCSALPIQKQDRAKRLVVCGDRRLAVVGHHRKEGLHILCAHVSRMAHAGFSHAPSNGKPNPIQLSFFSLQAIVPVRNPLTHLIGQAGRLQRRRTGFQGKFYSCLFIRYVHG
jgi:hypothetical protein